MTHRAQRFRGDALRARRALAAVRPSSARGRRAKQLALAAFRDYTLVGRHWTLSGKARLRERRLTAVSHARAAQKLAREANRLLVASGKLLRYPGSPLYGSRAVFRSPANLRR